MGCKSIDIGSDQSWGLRKSHQYRSMGCAGGSSGRVVVNQGLSAKQRKRCFVEIKWAIEFVVGSNERIAMGKTSQVEREFDLW